jgi:Mg2+/citrate symporter
VPWDNVPVHALAILALDRASAIIAAFFALIVSGVVVSLGAWILLRRERHRDR